MRGSLRRFLIFIIMVIIGTVLILFNLPLLFIIVLVTVIGFLLLVLFSPATASEVKLSILNLNKISFIRRQKENKTYIKIAEQKVAEPQKTMELRVESFEIPEKKSADRKRGFSPDLRSLFSSFRSLGTMLRTGKKPERKPVDENEKLVDKPAREKVNVSALALAGELTPESGGKKEAKSRGPGSSSAMAGSPSPRVDDPFLSLSSDELESGLLDTADEEEKKGTGISPDTPPLDSTPPHVQGSSGVTIGESDIPIPPQEVTTDREVTTEGQEQTASNEPDLDEFTGFEGADTIDQNLDELDTLDLDSVELDDDTWEEEPDTASPPPPALPEPVTPAPEPQVTTELTATVSPAPLVPGMHPRAGEPADMTVFTTPVSADDEMVSSIAADIRIAKKKRDVSLLRELKEIKPPGAKEIEEELSDLYLGLSAVADKKSKTKLS